MEFGLDNVAVETLDYRLALKRIANDLQGDFIYAPHLAAVFHRAGDDLWDRLRSVLRSGTFRPRLPITLEVPKLSGFPRPGSILWPLERLAYQVVVDRIALNAETTLDRSRVFSCQLLSEDPDGYMFAPAGQAYSQFKDKIAGLCRDSAYTHSVAADVASYFERLYQHVLVNLLHSAGCESLLVTFLEKVLLAFTQKESHGIVQGLFPSDFLGTFYLCAIDAQHDSIGAPSVRYVDDMFVFFESEGAAKKHQVRLATWLRSDGLAVNEAKSGVRATGALQREQTEVENLFETAVAEVESELDRADFYGSTISWDVLYGDSDTIVEEPDEVELVATKRLFDVQGLSGGLRKKVDTFCIAAFGAAEDDYALDYVVERFASMPYMAQPFAKYLKSLLPRQDKLVERLSSYLSSDKLLFDYQRLWLYALLSLARNPGAGVMAAALRDLTNPNLSPAVRVACAVLVGVHGSAPQRRILRNHYQAESSDYVRAGILYAARNFPKPERESCFTAWSGHDEVNSLIVRAAKKLEGA